MRREILFLKMLELLLIIERVLFMSKDLMGNIILYKY